MIGISTIFRPFRALFRMRGRLPSTLEIPPRALLLHQERADIRAAFDLNTKAGRDGLVLWYLRYGFRELGLMFEAEDAALADQMNQAVPNARQHAFLPITWLMQCLATLVPEYRKQGWTTAADQARLLSWYFALGLDKANLSGFLTPEQASSLLSPSDDHPTVPRLLACIWDSVPQLHTRFKGVDDQDFTTWCQGEGSRRFPILYHPLIAIAPRPVRRSPHLKPFGVNLFGHARGRSGISEDVRMAKRVLEEAGIPFVVHNVSPGPAIPEEEQDENSSNSLIYSINMFCMTAEATASAISATGHATIADHYNIGFWPWELSTFPKFWRHTYNFVDEIWSSSLFTYESFRNSSPVPVRYMPFAVVTEDSQGLGRDSFALPPKAFLFGFAFDGLSSFARKAPLATIHAFQHAFARDDRSVGLVIKGLRVANAPQWQPIVDAAVEDGRIHVVTSSLERGKLLDLWRAIDCFVSLHRSEGFGRNIAETMLLGKLAIATGYSGNCDFTRDDTAAIVPYALCPVGQGEYPYGTGQVWANPDVAAAAALMRRAAEDVSWRSRLSSAGQSLIRDKYAPGRICVSWKAALEAIHEKGSKGITTADGPQ